MALSDEDASVLAELIDENGYTAVLDAMADIAHADIKRWKRQGGPRDAVGAIVADLRRTYNAIRDAALDVRG